MVQKNSNVRKYSLFKNPKIPKTILWIVTLLMKKRDCEWLLNHSAYIF